MDLTSLSAALDLVKERGLLDRLELLTVGADGQVSVRLRAPNGARPEPLTPSKGELEARADRDRESLESDYYAATSEWR